MSIASRRRNSTRRPVELRRYKRWIVDDTLSQAMPDLRQTDAASVHRRHELDECRKCMLLHASMPKANTLVFSATQEYTDN